MKVGRDLRSRGDKTNGWLPRSSRALSSHTREKQLGRRISLPNLAHCPRHFARKQLEWLHFVWAVHLVSDFCRKPRRLGEEAFPSWPRRRSGTRSSSMHQGLAAGTLLGEWNGRGRLKITGMGCSTWPPGGPWVRLGKVVWVKLGSPQLRDLICHHLCAIPDNCCRTNLMYCVGVAYILEIW
jgi:hypothetical protein